MDRLQKRKNGPGFLKGPSAGFDEFRQLNEATLLLGSPETWTARWVQLASFGADLVDHNPTMEPTAPLPCRLAGSIN